MRRSSSLLAGLAFLCLLAASFPVFAQDKVSDGITVKIDPPVIDIKQLASSILPVKPDDPKTEFELMTVIERQKHVTDEDLRRARSEDTSLNVYQFQDVLGGWFRQDNPNLAHTHALFAEIVKTMNPFIGDGKKYWQRVRPCFQDPTEVKFLGLENEKQMTELRKSYAFPSGHSTHGAIYALVLCDLAPDSLKEKILARGRQIGDDRVLLGVHFPSDVEAGRVLAREIYDGIKDQEGYKNAVAAAKVEVFSELAQVHNRPD